MSIASKGPANFTLRYIHDSTSNPLPKAPPARWTGNGGITSLIGAENGIDNTWEQVVLKQLPKALQNFGRPSGNPWSQITNIVQSFLKQG
ncbi:unnamed protein product [Gongylonema pulchrum]|uniref:Uncharacterized protein n=1 Tax=Gongylonema pulchrum TaxID=637853 RepID=A0A183D2B6_9BILA|nr:unnamed protein product [Gongylonema pulchrum]